MADNKNDRRVRYTRMVLKQALLELMKTTDMSRITVKAVCDLADVNRGTFYAHFDDPRQLLRQIEEELACEIFDTIQRHGIDTADTYQMIAELIQCLYDNRELCKTVLGPHGDVTFLNELIYRVQAACADAWGAAMSAESRPLLEYLYTFVARGSVGVVQKWIEKDMADPPQVIAAVINDMTYQGLRGYAGKAARK